MKALFNVNSVFEVKLKNTIVIDATIKYGKISIGDYFSLGKRKVFIEGIEFIDKYMGKEHFSSSVGLIFSITEDSKKIIETIKKIGLLETN